MKKEDFIKLTQKYAQGKTTPEESQIVERFFEAQQQQLVPEVSDQERERLFKRIQKHIPRQGVEAPLYYRWIAVAAILVMGLFGLQWFYQPDTVTQIAAKGEKKEVILQDGSIVMLNANSSLSYPKDFLENRQVTLQGQAFFKVARDEAHPFTVSTKHLEVQVLGTSFDVNANTYNPSKVSVVSGVVQVTDAHNKKNQVILRKDEQVTLKDTRLNRSNTDSNQDIAWTQNTIWLQNTSLKETAKILENWYDIDIEFENEALEALTMSGKYKQEKLENILKSMALLKNLKIDTITTKKVLIRENPLLN